MNPSRKKGRDELGQVVIGISQEEADRIYEKQEAKKRIKTGEKQGESSYITNQEKKNQIKQDFYMFQKRLVMKSDIEKLKENFE